MALFKGVLRLFGIGARNIRKTTEPLEQRYREFVDRWASEHLARWLHETRAEINPDHAFEILLGDSTRHPEALLTIRETLIDAKVTFSQKEGKQYLSLEAYLSPRQTNGKLPQLLRWHAEREIAWQEIPDDVREQLIRRREPITLGYTVPG